MCMYVYICMSLYFPVFYIVLKGYFFLVRLEVHYLLGECFKLFGSLESILVQRLILSFFSVQDSQNLPFSAHGSGK